MPATPSRIGFITQDVRVVTSGPNSEVAGLYGNAARDTTEPLETFFDDPADAQAMADERMDLLSAKRTLVTVTVEGFDVLALLDRESSLPTVRVVDDEQRRNSQALVVGMTVDLANHITILETWGSPGLSGLLQFSGTAESGTVGLDGSAQDGDFEVEI